MRPEHSETKAKTETRECETETETETKNLLWDRQVNCMWNWHNRYVLFVYYTHEVNDEPEMDFTFKMISK